jgi:hypothetical protein
MAKAREITAKIILWQYTREYAWFDLHMAFAGGERAVVTLTA